MPGPGGEALSNLLVLDVTEVAGDSVYRGPLSEQPAADLGTFAPGEQRTYRFAVAAAEQVRSDQAGGGMAASGFRWTLVGGGEASRPSVGPKRLTVQVRRSRVGRTVRRNRIRLTVTCSRRCRATVTSAARWRGAARRPEGQAGHAPPARRRQDGPAHRPAGGPGSKTRFTLRDGPRDRVRRQPGGGDADLPAPEDVLPGPGRAEGPLRSASACVAHAFSQAMPSPSRSLPLFAL